LGLVELAISSSCLDVAPGLRFTCSTYLIWKTTDELHALPKLPKLPLDNAALCDFHHDFHTNFLNARDRLFQQPLVYIFGIIPVLGMLMCDCSQALIVRRNALLSSGQFSIRADVHRTGVGRLSLHYSSNHHL